MTAETEGTSPMVQNGAMSHPDTSQDRETTEWAVMGRFGRCVHACDREDTVAFRDFMDRRCDNEPHHIVKRTCSPWKRVA